ncbi:MAG TPA: AmmeMemoRadiSam system protein A [Candidatus Excrementavichristensenella intestinipullorum]|nr:AmmeMemoRadiSam system protein A [Candidatus Excrementavichristensenella intestinipullorum]
MSIVGAIIVPHPPVILPTVGKGREKQAEATLRAYRAAAAQVRAWAPEALVIASPHIPLYADYFHICPGRQAQGDMAAFGAPQTRLTVACDVPLRREMCRLAGEANLPAGTLGAREERLDHGSFLPLYFLQEAGVDCPAVRMGLSGLSPLDHYRLGQCVAQAAQALNRRVVFVASGDLSHKLKADGPYGFAPQGPQFDRQVTQAMAQGDFLALLTMDPLLCRQAAECGLRSFQIMAGALDGQGVASQLLSHQDDFGVGYAVALFAPQGPDPSRRFAQRYQAAEAARLAARRAGEDPWVRLARLALETWVNTGKALAQLPPDLPPELTNQAAGAFVSLHIRDQLRGCIGTTAPTRPCLAWEIAGNAVSAGVRDPRFSPVTRAELDQLEYSVDVLTPPEPIDSPAQLDAKRYGVIVSRGGRRGLLLPDLEGVDTVEQQIAIARKKAGIAPHEPCALERFEVVRHH